MEQQRASNLTAFIHNQTKAFREELHARYQPARQDYFHSIYTRLAQCFDQHITPLVQAQLDSQAMLDYYSCYKRTLRWAKDNNKRLYEQGLDNQIRLKQCIELKSSLTKSSADFQNQRNQCYEEFAKKYDELYASIFEEKSGNSVMDTAKAGGEQGGKK